MTREEDVTLISNSGAHYIGLLIDMPSVRTLDETRAATFATIATIPVVLLFFDHDIDHIVHCVERIAPAAVQLQGHESPEDVSHLRTRIKCEIWKGIHLPAAGSGEVPYTAINRRMYCFHEMGADKLLLDTYVKTSLGLSMGGTGMTYDWDFAATVAATAPCPVFMAGGLSPENVAEAIGKLHPFGVDLASGIESSKGIKDPAKVAAFVKAVRDA